MVQITRKRNPIGPGQATLTSLHKLSTWNQDITLDQDVCEVLPGTKQCSRVCMKEEWRSSVIDISGVAL